MKENPSACRVKVKEGNGNREKFFPFPSLNLFRRHLPISQLGFSLKTMDISPYGFRHRFRLRKNIDLR